MRDGRTPTLINALMVATKVVLVLVTNEMFRAPSGTNINLHPSARAVEWLNISTSLSYVVGAIAGHLLLSRRLGRGGGGSVGLLVLVAVLWRMRIPDVQQVVALARRR